MPTKKEEEKPAVTLVYGGCDIYLTGSEESRNEIIVFSHTFMDGTSETIGLRLDKHYTVGGKDENGKIIKDWVYDRFMTSDLNQNRKKTRGELKAEKNSDDENLTLDMSL